MSKLQLKKLLNSMDKQEVISIILEMYDERKEIKEYLDYYIDPDEQAKFEKYKKVISREYSLTANNSRARLSVAKKAISDFSKLHPAPMLEAELMIYLVESGCKYCNYGSDYIGTSFLIGMENNFARALKFMDKHGLLEEFRPRAEQCIEYAGGCEYGFSNNFIKIFREHYGSERFTESSR